MTWAWTYTLELLDDGAGIITRGNSSRRVPADYPLVVSARKIGRRRVKVLTDEHGVVQELEGIE